jgi:hypothetical protein
VAPSEEHRTQRKHAFTNYDMSRPGQCAETAPDKVYLMFISRTIADKCHNAPFKAEAVSESTYPYSCCILSLSIQNA